MRPMRKGRGRKVRQRKRLITRYRFPSIGKSGQDRPRLRVVRMTLSDWTGTRPDFLIHTDFYKGTERYSSRIYTRSSIDRETSVQSSY